MVDAHPAMPLEPPIADRSRPVMFVTGGSRGLGRELVRHFASKYNVAFGWQRSEADAASLTAEITGRGEWVMPLQLDLRDLGELVEAARAVQKAAGACQALVHTAGTFSMKRLDEMDPATWRDEIDSTVNAGFFAWRAFASQLRSHPRARVVFIGDSAADQMRARRQSTSYHIGKHGLLILAKAIAAEHQQTGLTCNMVSPGVMPNSIDLDQAGMKVNVDFSEVAGVIDYLLSPAADSVSGSNLIASRGWNV